MAIYKGVGIPFIQLAEGTGYPEDGWFQILKTGTFQDPRYGKFKITRKMFAEMIRNFNDGVRGIVPALDYKHDSEDIAAGWFKELAERNIKGEESEFWGRIDLTPRGQKKLNEKEFGYLSADFDEAYTDNEAPFKKYGCVLKGAGLTNRPVIKGMKSATQLSENGDNMPTIEELQKKVTDQEKVLSEKEVELAELKKFSDSMKKVMAAMEANSPEDALAAINKLKPAKEEPAMPKEMAELKAENEKLKRENEFSVLLSEGKVIPAQKDAFIKNDMTAFAKASLPGGVNLAEKGNGGAGGKKEDEGTESAEDKVRALALAEQKANEGLSIQECYSRVLAEPKNAALKKEFYKSN